MTGSELAKRIQISNFITTPIDLEILDRLLGSFLMII